MRLAILSLLAIQTSCASLETKPICPDFPALIETPADVANVSPLQYRKDVAENYLRLYQWGAEMEALAGCP